MESNKQTTAQVVIPLKLPSLNEYVNACRTNKFAGGKMKKDAQRDISIFLKRLPTYKAPVRIRFHWVEKNAKRDLDNIAFAKKFILDALVESGKLVDDSRKWVVGFEDEFSLGKDYAVILTIEEA